MTTPLNIATDGYIDCDLNSISIASNGYLCQVHITPGGHDTRNDGYIVKGGKSTQIRRREREKRERERYFKDQNEKDEKNRPNDVLKMITVIVNKNGKDFIESKMVRTKPDLSIKDVDIQVNEVDNKPKITINVLTKPKKKIKKCLVIKKDFVYLH